MTKYLLNRILRSVLSVIVVVLVVMFLIYSCMDRNNVINKGGALVKYRNNAKAIMEMTQLEKYGYVDYVPYADYLQELLQNGDISQETFDEAVRFANYPSNDTELVTTYVEKFTEYYESKGYEVKRLDALYSSNNRLLDGGEQRLFAYRDISIFVRLWEYFSSLFCVDNIHNAEGIPDEERGLTFTLYDPVYGGEVFSPAIIGNGTTHKYLLYFSDQFPYIHQNLLTLKLGTSISVNKGIDVFQTMTASQGAYVYSTVTYPNGVVDQSADDLHSATYVAGSLDNGTAVVKGRYTDDYTNVSAFKNGLSKMGYSFIIGIISVILAYVLAIPLGTLMALKKDKLIDKIGTLYIIFVMAVPSLAYIFLFQAIGGAAGLPTTFDLTNPTWMMYILPIISLALPSVANLMKWLRRYMIDQMNSDYVKFARSGGLSEGEIFSKHVLKNAIIPIVHGIPGSVLGALVGAIITERVYTVPGAGNLLTEAINLYDNRVIVGVTLFYAVLSVTSIILGDILMSIMDPRISFTKKER